MVSAQMRQKAVFVLDGTPRTVVAISRSLRARGLRVIHGFFGARPLSIGSNAVARNVRVLGTPTEFYGSLLPIITENDIDTVFACSDKSLRLLAPHYDALKALAQPGFPAPEKLDLVLDKEATLRVAERCNVKVPKTFRIKDAEALSDQRFLLPFPLIAKPARVGVHSAFKTRRFNDIQALAAALELDNIGESSIFQEFFQGQGVGITTIMHEGEPLVLFQHRRVHEWPATGGVGVLMVSETVDARLASDSVRLLQEIGWQGPAMVEFRQNLQDDTFVLMEINGRFAGSLPLGIAAGLDFPYWAWQILHSEKPELPSTFQNGLKMRWTTGEIFRLRDLWNDAESRKQLHCNRIQAAAQFVASFDPTVRSALFDRRDMKPALIEVTLALRGLARTLLKSIVKSILPRSTQKSYLQYSLIEKKCRPTYRRLWLRRIFRSTRSATRQLDQARSVLFVCRGNRIRSPLAAVLLQSRLGLRASGLQISSAGTRAVSPDHVDERAVRFASDAGVAINHTPQRLSEKSVQDADLIVVMDHIVEAELLSEFSGADGKTFLLPELSRPGSKAEILDPDTAAEKEFLQTMMELQEAVNGFASRLKQKAMP